MGKINVSAWSSGCELIKVLKIINKINVARP